MKESILGSWRIKQEDSGVVSIQHIDSFKRVEFGPYTTEKLVIKVYNGRSFEQVCVSLLALREALNMLEGKGDDTPVEPEPEIDMEEIQRRHSPHASIG